MNQIAHYEGNSCLSSWDNFQHCYPSFSKIFSLPHYYVCNYWTLQNLFAPYLFRLNNPHPQEYLNRGFASAVAGKTLNNLICYGKMPWSFSNIAEVGFHVLQIGLMTTRVVHQYLKSSEVDPLAALTPEQQAAIKNIASLSEHELFLPGLAFLTGFQMYFFDRDHFGQLESSTSKALLLHQVAESNSKESVLYLLERGARINQKDNLGNTPLHKGAIQGAYDSVLCLLENGADRWAKNDRGDTFLNSAIRADQEGFIDRLLQMDLEMPWEEALIFAMKLNNKKIALLIESKIAIHTE